MAIITPDGGKTLNFAEHLALLNYNGDGTETITVCHKPHDAAGGFGFSFIDPRQAHQYVLERLAQGYGQGEHIWFSVNPVDANRIKARGSSGRGEAEDITRLTSLYADLDVEPGKCPDMATVDAIITEVSGYLGERPVMRVYSGHGQQPFWVLDRESAERLSNEDAQLLKKWVGRLVQAVARHHNSKVDNVFDLTRILRVPETFNRKDHDQQPIPVVAVLDEGKPLTVEQVITALEDFGISAQEPGPASPNGSSSQGGGEHYEWFPPDWLIRRVAKAPEGRRNTTLYGAVKDAVRQGDLDGEMLDRFITAAQRVGLDDKEIETTVKSAWEDAEQESEKKATDQQSTGWTFTDGASFILDIPDIIPALWGTGQQVLWAEGESLMITSLAGLGKTTVAGMLIHAQLLTGLGDIDMEVLGLPVARRSDKILYLAMDRPAQIRRSLHRQFPQHWRDVLKERLVVWKGPPPADIAKNPALLAELAAAAGAGVVYLDSVKDAAIGLSDDAVGAGYNRARQLLLSQGVELCELHHTVKRSSGGGAPNSVADVYGSAWITNGTGSIILLTGEPGDPVVGFRHLRSPAWEYGPLILTHDANNGTVSILSDIDPVAVAGQAHPDGITARGFAVVMFDNPKPTRGQIEKARRALDAKVGEGSLRCVPGSTGGPGGGTPTMWFLP
jgi:hypothetical protein